MTYVMEPSKFVNLRIGTNVTFEVDVISLFDVSWI